MAIQEIMSADFEEVVLKSEKPVLVDFNATWCGPCRMLKPTLDQVAAERTDVTVVGVDIDENMDLAEEYGVFSIPCLVLFKDGAEAERSVGLVPKERVLALLG
jgi:thioredoxin 1